MDFISKISGIELTENDWLVTYDVSSLYTNIPHHEGIRIIHDLLEHEDTIPSKNYVLKMLNLVLKCNCFKFNEQYFLQINGTAMGTRVAPTYAIIFMNHFEDTYIYPKCKEYNIKYWF